MSNQSNNAPELVTLNSLSVGDCAFVADVAKHIPSNDKATGTALFDISRRLKELGFIRGEKIKILHKGYFGGEPVAVRIGQSTFALRNFEAALIGVTKAGIV
ncbi:MAG: ferrous iron transport protein A [Burkholderiales bacterium]|nr:ferrous iron transport protein A [Burkholderiales bacterium]